MNIFSCPEKFKSVREIAKLSQKFMLMAAVVILTLSVLTLTNIYSQSLSQSQNRADATAGSPLGSYDISEFENVDLFNGGLNFKFPLAGISNRGDLLPAEISLRIQSQWGLTPDRVLRYGEPYDVYFPQSGSSNFDDAPPKPSLLLTNTTTLTYFTYYTPTGERIKLYDVLKDGQPAPVDMQYGNRGRIFISKDGSRITFVSDFDLHDDCPPPPGDWNGCSGWDDTQASGYLYFSNGTMLRVQLSNILWSKDRNGNKRDIWNPTTGYGNIKDNLGREIKHLKNVNNVPNPNDSDSEDKVITKGMNGVDQVTRILYKKMSNGLLRNDMSIQLIKDLFPVDPAYSEIFQPCGPGGNYDPYPYNNSNCVADFQRPASIILPDNRQYNFKYNSYGRLARVELPVGTAVEYDWADARRNGQEGNVQHLNQRLIERRIYDEANNLVTRTTYSRPLYTDLTGSAMTDGYVEVATFSSNNILIAKSKHYFHWRAPGTIYPASIYDPNPSPQAQSIWYSSKEYKTEFFGADGTTILHRNLTEWKNKTVSWVTNQDSAPSNDPRPANKITISFENGKALAVLMRTEYDEIGSSDPEVFSHLNVTRKKSYNYKVLNLSTAQNGDFDSIASLFSESDLASVSETDYLYDAGYKDRHILGLSTETRVMNPVNPTQSLAKSQIVYDEQNQYYSTINLGSTIGYETPTGIYAHLRGNATTYRTWFAEENRWIETHTQYDNFGNMRKAWDSSGDQNRFVETEYSSQYYYAYPTKKIVKGPGDGIHGTTENSTVEAFYDFWTGLITSVTDDNGQVTITEYDNRLRPKKMIPPAGSGITEKIYGDTPGNLFIKTRAQVDANNWAETTVFIDNFGRVYRTQTKDLQGDIFSEIEYDNFGRVKRVSNPYRQGEPKYWRKPRYDNQGRVVETYAPAPDGQTGASTGTVEFDISTLSGLIGNYVTATDASGRKARSFTNIYDQTVRVDEPTGNNDLGSLDNPNQPSYYFYNVKSELIKIKQGKQNETCGTTAQCRYFMYDSLGRLTRVRQPEQTPHANLATTGNPENNQWTSGFTYDVFGNVTTVTDARGITITNTYDKAGRMITNTYNDGVTPQTNYFYDGTGLSQIPQFAKGNLTKISNGISETRYTSFDNYGGIRTSQQTTDGRNFDFEYKYDGFGNLIEETYPSGRVVKTSLDTDGGLAAVSSKMANTAFKTYASNFNYSATGNVKAMMLGNGRWETASFNERQQIIQIGLGSNANDTSLWKINYDYGELNTDGSINTSKNVGMVAKQTINLPTTAFVQTYKYDALNRLIEAKENANTVTGAENWKQTFDYDRFGNRTSFYQKVGTNVLPINNLTNPQIDPATNRFTTGQGYIYDYNGNLVQNAENRGFTYDGDDKQIVVRNLNIPTTPQNPNANVTGRYYYDGYGKRVKKETNLETTIFVYNAAGTLIAEYSTQTNPNPTTSYLTTDNLGSPRIVTDKNGNVTSRRDFMPFGEEILASVGARDSANMKYSASGIDNIRQRFTGYEKDIEADLDFAEARMYKNQHGRFTAPDPLLSSADLDNPQSFNRYIYVGNNPINITDPSGLDWCRSEEGNITFTKGRCNSNLTTLGNGSNIKITEGGIKTNDGTNASVGDVVQLNADGSATLVSLSQQRSAQVAATTGAEVQATSDPVAMTGGSVLGSITPQSLLPLPCPDGQTCNSTMAPPPPSLTEGASADELLVTGQIVLDLIGGTEIPIISQAAEGVNILIDASTGDLESAGLGAASLIPIAGEAATAGKIAKRLKKLAEIVNGNSKLSKKSQHLYEVFETATEKVVKTGVSDGKITKSGKSYRAEKQVRKWNRAEGAGKYSSRIVLKVPAGKGARVKILRAEIRNARKHRKTLDPEKHHRP